MMRRLAVFLFVVLQAWFVAEIATARDFQDIMASGKLRVAIAEEDFVPWLMRDKLGQPIGFEADIARQISDGLGVDVEFVETTFPDLIATLLSGEADIIISGLSITPERARRVLFSAPYGQTDLELVVNLPLLPEGAEGENYDMEGMRIAVVAATTLEYEGRSRFPASQIVAFPSESEARDGFINDEVNAIIAAKPYPAFIVSRDPERFASAGDPLTSTSEAMAVAPDNFRLLNYVNAWITQAMSSGFLEEATHHWFETLDWTGEVPGLEEIIEQSPSGDRQ